MSESLDEHLAAHGPEIARRVHGRDRTGARDLLGGRAEELSAEVWSRDVPGARDRRPLLSGPPAGAGRDGMAETRLGTATRTGGLTPEEPREVVVSLTRYADRAGRIVDD